MDTLEGTTTGRFALLTESGTQYEIDLDQRRLTRKPSATEGMSGTVFMRGDDEGLTLHSVRRCEVGLSAVFLIDAARDGATVTLRMTTPVISITAVSPPG